MIYSTISDVLTAHVAAIPSIPDWQKENTRYNGSTGTPFIRTTMLPAAPTIMSLGVGGITMHQGLFQIDCFTPQDQGNTAALAQADAIMDAFKEGVKLTSGAVTVEIVTSNAQSAYQLLTYYGVPVVVSWRCYYTRT